MPIRFSGNNRIIPANARAADVAQSAVKRIIDVQNRRYDAAFEVQGYDAVLYNMLTMGLPCSCGTVNKSLVPRLDEHGNASKEDINSLLTEELFAITPYGVKHTTFVPNQDRSDPNNLPSAWESSAPKGPTDVAVRGRVGQPLDVFGDDDSENPNVSTVISDGVGPNGPVDIDINELITDFDSTGFGTTDVSCPICFGNGFVGGFSVYNGWRKVLTAQNKKCRLFGGALESDRLIPYAKVNRVVFDDQIFPMHAVGVDAMRVFGNRTVLGAKILIDNVQLMGPSDLMKFCDGRGHVIDLQFSREVEFTHLELQLNQSTKSTLFEYPRTSKGSAQNLNDATQSVTINLSPSIPHIRPKDIVIDSSLGKVWQVTSVNNWNTRSMQTLGWDCDMRVVQPQELFDILPRRRPVQARHNVPAVRDNESGNRRT